MKTKIFQRVENFILVCLVAVLLSSYYFLVVWLTKSYLFVFPEVDVRLLVSILGFIFSFSILFYKSIKKYTFKNTLKWILFLVIAGLNIFFYYQGVIIEEGAQDSWSSMPELSSMYSTLVYIKAIGKILLVDGLVVIGILLAKHK